MISGAELLLIAAALLAAGCATGFIAGLLGIGGGGIMVPVLYEVFSILEVAPEIRIQMSVGTALAVMIPTSLRSAYAHASRGAVDMAIVRRLALPVVAGVAVGSVIVKYAPSDTLKWVWVTCSLVIAAKMLFAREHWRLGTEVPQSRWLETYGIGIGIVSSLMSIGGGAFVTMMMTFYGRTIQHAVATASAFGPIVALPGMVGFIWAGWGQAGLPPLSLGYVSVLGAAVMIPTSVLTAPLGARVAHGISRRTLERAFGVFLLCVATRFLFALFG